MVHVCEKYICTDHRICTALEKTVHFGRNTIVNEVKSHCERTVYQRCTVFFFGCTQLFKNIYMRTTEFAQLWKKLYILVQTPLWMKLRAKYSVVQMYSFLIVLQLFENIYMRTTEFVQLWKKTVQFGTNTIVNEIKSQIQCSKDIQLFYVQLFNSCTGF